MKDEDEWQDRREKTALYSRSNVEMNEGTDWAEKKGGDKGGLIVAKDKTQLHHLGRRWPRVGGLFFLVRHDAQIPR